MVSHVSQNILLCYRYDIMKDCWKELPNERPAFSVLVRTISAMVGEIAGYLDLTATPLVVDVGVDIEDVI